nr:pyocin knob domain-containing protein [Chromobacterium sp. ASV5]
MNRQSVYAGQILPETTLLNIAKDSMIGHAKLAAALFGSGPIANGFAVTPTSPASLQVIVAPGELYSLQNIDSTQWSSLPADTTHQIVKQGFILDPQTLTLAAATASGQSIVYLVQAAYQDVDANAQTLPYYNSANPNQPFSGPNNNGQSQPTVRQSSVQIVAKPGIQASSPVAPAPDAGFVGLYTVTVGYGQTQITAANIQQYASAPLLPAGGLLQALQSGSISFAIDTGTTNNYAVMLTPAQTVRQEGEVIRFKAKTTNTGSSTLNDGLGAAPLVGGAHQPLQGGEIVAGGDAWAQWNASIGANGSYILLFCTGAAEQVANATQSQHAVTLGQVQNGYFPFQSNLGASVDLNAITTPGQYIQPSSTNAGSGLNYPIPNAGVLIVYSQAAVSSTTGVIQEYFVYSGAGQGQIYVRVLLNSSWTAWQQLAGLNSPTFTGTPTAPTAAVGTNTTQLATTAFTTAAIGSQKGIRQFTSSGTFTVPANVTTIYISGCGGGGGGGASYTSTPTGGGGGGGAGQSIIRAAYSVNPGSLISITVGAAGAGGTPGGATGSAGGQTIVGSLVTLAAGTGGNSSIGATGGAPAAIGYPTGTSGSDTAYGGAGGAGASGPFGGGGGGNKQNSSGAANAGITAAGYGAGGGGAGGVAASGGSGAPGGAGSPGLVIIEW